MVRLRYQNIWRRFGKNIGKFGIWIVLGGGEKKNSKEKRILGNSVEKSIQKKSLKND